ncbi:MAG: hypothetical protein EB145_12000 [Proteobacteria bacterium]|nr:hypothetical protein [Pseudomonadota bacterium]
MRDQETVPAEIPLVGNLATTGRPHAPGVTTDQHTAGQPTNRWALGAVLGDRALRRDVIRLAWPVVVEQLLATSVGLVDVAVIGRTRVLASPPHGNHYRSRSAITALQIAVTA